MASRGIRATALALLLAAASFDVAAAQVRSGAAGTLRGNLAGTLRGNPAGTLRGNPAGTLRGNPAGTLGRSNGMGGGMQSAPNGTLNDGTFNGR